MIGSCFDSDVRFVFAEDSGFIFDAPENQHVSIPPEIKHQTTRLNYTQEGRHILKSEAPFFKPPYSDGFSVLMVKFLRPLGGGN